MLTFEQIANVAHEANRAYCLALGDHTQCSWDQAPAWQKDSAINGVKFHLNNPQATPASSHESWLKQKREEGWAYGAVKDPMKKLHPCFVPYNELPEAQQVKDYLFRSVVHTLLEFGVQGDVTYAAP